MVIYVNVYCIIDELMYIVLMGDIIIELFDVVSRWYDHYYWVIWWWFMSIYIVLLIDIIEELFQGDLCSGIWY